MAATVHVLHPQSAPIAAFLRVGHTGHKKLEALLSAGRFPYRRIVMDAAHLAQQSELLKALRASGCEIVLDPNFAEAASAGRFGGAIGRLPWGNPERPWEPSDLGPGRNRDLITSIAEFAVQYGVGAVLSPTHLIENNDRRWQAIDFSICEQLREELDRHGGREITIDYQVITTTAFFKDGVLRQHLFTTIAQLPIENVWLRTSGFGSSATGAGTRAFIEAARELHSFGRPLVADFVGGLAGLACGAFGAIGGISHGAGQKESFRSADWKKPPNGGGQARRIYIPELDRHFSETQLDQIFAARGGRSRLGCNDTSCCADGCDDMVENAHAHFITQRFRQIENLNGIPEPRRAEHFLLEHLDPAVRSARYASRLKIADEKTKRLVSDAKVRLIRIRDVLADLRSREGTPTRSIPIRFRGGRGTSMGAVLGT